MNYDLEERTTEFSVQLLLFLKKIKINNLNKNIVYQLARSATSIGANYREANGSSSKKDFRNKILICKKECKETEYWIEILAKVDAGDLSKLRCFWRENRELTLIFSKIAYKSIN